MKYKIDPELDAVCLPLTDEEYSGLEKQILRDGCLDPVKVWDLDGELVLLDGHHRLKICKKHKLPIPESTTIEIANIHDAIIWISDNQFGRRNAATVEQRNYISGKRYAAQKMLAGRPCAEERAQIALFVEPGSNRTARATGLKEKIDPSTVKRNRRFAEGIDAIRATSPDLAEQILKSNASGPKLCKREIEIISTVDPIELHGIVLQGVDALKDKAKDLREAEKDRAFQAAQAAIKQDVAEYHAVQKEKFGGATYACGLSSIFEMWCTPCKCAFDVFKPHQALVCPVCGGNEIGKRDEMWYPGMKVK